MQNHKLFIHFGLLFVFRNLTQLGFMFAVAPQNKLDGLIIVNDQ